MISGRSFILLSSIEWDFLWQAHQEIASRVARAGNRVLYIETTGVRGPRWGDARRIAKRVSRWTRAAVTQGVRQVAPDLYVSSPLILPPFDRAGERTINRKLLIPLVARTARNLGMRDPVLWSFLPTETTLDLVRALATPAGAVVYHCLADFTRLASNPLRIAASEREMLRLSDLVLALCGDLARHCRRWSSNVHILPPGVDLTAFTLRPHSPAGPWFGPSDSALMQALSSPVIGYVGGLHQHVDFELLIEAARARPQWSWVFVGPRQSDVGELGRLPNVHLLGQRPHDRLSDYLSAFDVCIVPYLLSSFTETVVPTKINEYLAMGKPVVSTAMSSVRELNGCGEVILLAEPGVAGFLRTVERAIRQNENAWMPARRREVAALSDWGRRFETASALLESVLDGREDAGVSSAIAAPS